MAGLSQLPYIPELDRNSHDFFRIQKSFLGIAGYGKLLYPPQTEDNNNNLPLKKSKEETCLDLTLLMQQSIAENISENKQPKNVADFLLEETALPRLRQIIWIGVTSFVFPWYWDSNTNQILSWKGNRRVLQAWWVIWTLIAIQTASLTILQGYLITAQILDGHLQSYRAIFANYLAIFWYVFTVAYNVLMYLRMEEIRVYINTLIRLHRNLCGGW